MASNVTLPGAGAVVETLDIGSGVERQVITISPRDLSTGDSIGTLTEAAPASDTASSGLNGRLQRIAQNLTSYSLNDAGNAAPIAGTGNASVSSATNLFSIDTTGYNGISVQITSPGTTCTVTYEGSNDNATWVAINGTLSTGAASNTPATTTTTAAVVVWALGLRYFRARVSTYGSGTVTAYYALRRTFVPSQMQVAANGLVVSVPASAFSGYTYAHVAAGQATTVIKASAGTLHSITFNSKGTATNTTTIYDNATGAGIVIAIPDAPNINAGTTLMFDIAFTLGCTIITATANGGDMTVAFK